MLAQIVPLDAERQREAEVWFAFIARARVDEELRVLSERTDEALRGIVRRALEPLSPPDLDLAVEEMYALVDGLTMHAVLHALSRETIQRVLREALGKLATRR